MFIQTIESMNFNIKNLYTSSQLVQSQYLCYNWSISLKYEFIAMSHIVAMLDAQPVYCQFLNSSNYQDTNFLNNDVHKTPNVKAEKLVYAFINYISNFY